MGNILYTFLYFLVRLMRESKAQRMSEALEISYLQ